MLSIAHLGVVAVSIARISHSKLSGEEVAELDLVGSTVTRSLSSDTGMEILQCMNEKARKDVRLSTDQKIRVDHQPWKQNSSSLVLF